MFVNAGDQVLSHFLVRTLSEFKIVPVLIEMTVKGSFERVAVRNVAFSRENDSSCFPFEVLILEH